MGKAASYSVRIGIAVAEIEYTRKPAQMLSKLMLANYHDLRQGRQN